MKKIDDPDSLKDLIRKLFVGDLDVEYPHKGVPYKNRTMETQKDIADVLNDVMSSAPGSVMQVKHTQGGVSKAMKSLIDRPFEYKGSSVMIKKIDGQYKLNDLPSIKENAKARLEVSESIIKTGFFKSNYFGKSTCYAFHVIEEGENEISKLLSEALGETFFDYILVKDEQTQVGLFILLLNHRSPSFSEDIDWIENVLLDNK